MSQLVLTQGAQPSTPSAGKSAYWLDTDGRFKMVDSNGVVTVLSQSSKQSAILNGNFALAQRQNPLALATYSNTSGRALSADRWAVTNENASVQLIVTDTIGTPESALSDRYYAKYSKITNAGKLVLSQTLEASQTGKLRGKTVRVQFKMKYTVAASMSVRIGLAYLTASGTVDTIPATFVSAFGAPGVDPTLGTNLTLIAPSTVENATISGSGATCVLTSGWVRYSATFVVPSTAKNLVVLAWSHNQLAIGDVLNISEAGLYLGAEAVDWDPPAFATELAACQRYYQKTFSQGTLPAQNAGTGTGEFRWTAVSPGAAADPSPSLRFPAVMRTAPTVITYNPAAANAQVRDETAGADCSAAGTSNLTDSGLQVTCTGNAGSLVGNVLGAHLTMDAEL